MGILSQKSCKSHSLSWKLSEQELKDLFDKKCLKATFKCMDDNVEFFLEIDPEDSKAFLVNVPVTTFQGEDK